MDSAGQIFIRSSVSKYTLSQCVHVCRTVAVFLLAKLACTSYSALKGTTEREKKSYRNLLLHSIKIENRDHLDLVRFLSYEMD